MVTIFAGVPGQANWMPVPQAPIGCPPGLEYLTAVDQLLIQQQVELLEGNLKRVRNVHFSRNLFFNVPS